MKNFYSLACLALVSAIATTGCIDDKYDLSDIDTTVQVKVDNLVIPLNIDQITLESVIEPDDNHIQIVNGEYCYVSGGDITSTNLSIPRINVNTPKINDIGLNIPIPAALVGLPVGSFDIDLNIPTDKEATFNINANVSDKIKSVDYVDSDLSFIVHISFVNSLGSLAKYVDLTGLKLQLPAYLKAEPSNLCNYDSSTGVLTINNTKLDLAKGLDINLKFNRINIGNGRFNNGKLNINEKIKILGGAIGIKKDYFVSGAKVPEVFGMSLGFTIYPFTVKTFTGSIEYNIENLSIPEVTIDDLPDVLSQPGTNLMMYNPCIFINVKNPLNAYKIKARVGMSITAHHDNGNKEYVLDQPFEIGDPYRNNGSYNYCLSPKDPTNVPQEYNHDLIHRTFSTLGDVLSGNGMPKSISINLTDPTVFKQQVTDFVLPQDGNLGDVSGSYQFLAPFRLKEGSTINYEDTLKDWSDEDLDNLTITGLQLSFTINTNIPVGVDLVGYPIDKRGRHIDNSVIKAHIEPSAKNQKVTVGLVRKDNNSNTDVCIKGLDGIEFVATATAADSEHALTPNMSISLSEIRPSVSGYYEKEL